MRSNCACLAIEHRSIVLTDSFSHKLGLLYIKQNTF